MDRSIEAPGEFIQTDVFGVFVLAEEALRQKVRRFIQVSTDEVYGEVLEGHSTEECGPQSAQPLRREQGGRRPSGLRLFLHLRAPAVVTRSSNNYGPRQYPEKLVPLFITNAIDDEPLPIYGTGLNRRDWLHVEDHCRALVSLLECPDVEGETFNIGAQNELDVLTITRTILGLLQNRKP